MSIRQVIRLNSRYESRAVMHTAFAGICLVSLVLNHRALYPWLELSHTSEQSENLWMIPLITAFLLYDRRNAIFVNARVSPKALPWVLAGVLIQALSFRYRAALGATDATIVAVVGCWLTVTGAFLACYGLAAWKQARFSFAFLLFAVPLPEAMLDPVVSFLQHGSAAVVNGLFLLLRVPFAREDLTFHLSGLSIEIAPECSGIRSSYALLVLSVLLSYMLLNTKWRRFLAVAAVLPLAILKNGIRIVTLCLLTMHVDPNTLSGPLHHQGGFLFFGFAFVIEGMLCLALQRREFSRQRP